MPGYNPLSLSLFKGINVAYQLVIVLSQFYPQEANSFVIAISQLLNIQTTTVSN